MQYEIGESTVRDVFKQKDKLMQFASTSDNSSSMKSHETSTYEELDLFQNLLLLQNTSLQC